MPRVYPGSRGDDRSQLPAAFWCVIAGLKCQVLVPRRITKAALVLQGPKYLGGNHIGPAIFEFLLFSSQTLPEEAMKSTRFATRLYVL